MFTTGYKRLTEGGWGDDFLLWAFVLGFLLWAFCLRLLLLAFGLLTFGFFMWEALKRKRIAKGKRITEGK
jgi:hypothetical protein